MATTVTPPAGPADGDLSNNSASTVITAAANPGAIPSSALTPGSGCTGTAITLGSTNAATEWYATTSSSTILATGTSYTTPVLSTTTTYYASSRTQSTDLVTARTTRSGGTTSSVDGIGVEFSLSDAVFLKSVSVYGEAASYTFRITDAQNNIVKADFAWSPPGGYVATNKYPRSD